MPLAILLAALRDAPSRTGSVIITVYGDAIAPRGGEVALASLLELMAALGAGGGVVRTAVSRLARDGWLDGCRDGRRSFYRLSQRGMQEFAEAGQRIYGPLDRPWGGRLHIVFAEAGTNRTVLENAGYALIAPGVLISPDALPALPDGTLTLAGTGAPGDLRALAARVWPLDRISQGYARFLELFAGIASPDNLEPLHAAAVRMLLIHEYRRVVLRDPHLPKELLPPDWPGADARKLCIRLYAAVVPMSERWLDNAKTRSGPLPRGPDPATRFSGGDT